MCLNDVIWTEMYQVSVQLFHSVESRSRKCCMRLWMYNQSMDCGNDLQKPDDKLMYEDARSFVDCVH
jgi:hypothetical protein